MYSNGEGLGTPIGKPPADFSGSKRLVRCICPRCRKIFNAYMMWAGRGMPRKYCADCKAIIETYDESAIFESNNVALIPAKKRGEGVRED